MMTSDNWLEIAEAYGTQPEERTERQSDLAWMGLCAAAKYHPDNTDLDTNYYRIMYGLSGHTSGFPFGPEAEYGSPLGDSLRCLMACFLAAMTDAERREIGL